MDCDRADVPADAGTDDPEPVVVVCVALATASRTICPQEIRTANHKAQTAEWWADPEYQAIAAKRIEGETCHYCMQRPATLVHHDENWMYLTKEAYYDPENMTPACGKCHRMYRRGLVICPACRKHYMRRSSEKCQWCRGIMTISRKSGRYYPTGRYKSRHPCRFHQSYQGCELHRICTHSWKRARECRGFEERKKGGGS